MSRTMPSVPGISGTAVILLAAGAGTRLGYCMPKARVALGDSTIVQQALRRVLAANIAEAIYVVLPADDAPLWQLLAEPVEDFPEPQDSAEERRIPVIPVSGGAERTDSVRAALAALPENITRVLIHDAARALTPREVFHRVHTALTRGASAAIPVQAVTDTIKTVTDSSVTQIAAEQVLETLPRQRLRSVQTPQGFDVETLRQAHQKATGPRAATTDDAMLVEAQGTAVYTVPGSEYALKITTAQDLAYAELLLALAQQSKEKS